MMNHDFFCICYCFTGERPVEEGGKKNKHTYAHEYKHTYTHLHTDTIYIYICGDLC